MKKIHQIKRKQKARVSGQIMVLYGILLPLLFLFLGLGIDFGMMYITKARLSRSVDATALRMARKFSSEELTRKKIALAITRANLPGFMSGKTESDFSVSTSGIGSTDGQTLTLTDSGKNQKLEVNTKSGLVGVVKVMVTAELDHQTYFLPLANINKVHFTETATADRFPCVNILVLDISASMYGNGGINGLCGVAPFTDNAGGVQSFINEFDPTRDYMMVVTFSGRGTVVWPKVANFTDTIAGSPTKGLKFFGPEKDFRRASGGVMDSMRNYVTFASIDGSGTNGAEGLRYAAENIQKWLDNEVPNKSDRSLLSINYVFMTDGGFNVTRTYARGSGFGLDKTNLATEMAVSKRSVHNTFHDYQPIVGNVAGLSWDSTQLDSIFGTYTSADKMPGVNACIAPNDLNTGTKRIFAPYTQLNCQNDAFQVDKQWWDGLLLVGNDATTASVASVSTGTIINDQIRAEKIKMGAGGNWKISPDGTGGSGTSTEVDRNAISRMMVPLQIVSPLQNPAGGYAFDKSESNADNGTTYSKLSGNLIRNGITYFWLSDSIYQAYTARQKKAVLGLYLEFTDDRMTYYPAGTVYMNHAGSYVRETSEGPNEAANLNFAPNPAKNPSIFQKDGTELGWYFTSLRMADYYTDYNMAGDANQAAPEDKDSTTQYPGVAFWWSFREKKWTTGSTGGEGNWLNEAQAYVLRQNDPKDPLKYQNATIFSILYDNGGADMLKNVANDPSAPKYQANQNTGKYFKADKNKPEQLRDIFREIASKISVRISK